MNMMDRSNNQMQNSAATALVKYIRVTGDRDAQFVEFDFAINDPSLYVELVLPQQAFQHFCQVNHVVEMTLEQASLNDAQEDKWRYGEDTLMRHNRQTQDQEDQEDQEDQP